MTDYLRDFFPVAGKYIFQFLFFSPCSSEEKKEKKSLPMTFGHLYLILRIMIIYSERSETKYKVDLNTVRPDSKRCCRAERTAIAINLSLQVVTMGESSNSITF